MTLRAKRRSRNGNGFHSLIINATISLILQDVVVRRGERFWFYEIKTAMSAQACIREGLAQILKYSYWPGAQEAERLVIVGEPSLDGDAERYLATLKERFSLPIEYQQIDLAKGTH
jgi:hypothetical protein